MRKIIAIISGIVACFIAMFFASKKSGHNDGRGNSGRIDDQLDRERSNIKSGESVIRDREANIGVRQEDLNNRQGTIRETETIIDRDRDLLEELQKRHPKG